MIPRDPLAAAAHPEPAPAVDAALGRVPDPRRLVDRDGAIAKTGDA